jgi:hypothetical protein
MGYLAVEYDFLNRSSFSCVIYNFIVIAMFEQLFFLIRLVGGGVQLGSLGKAATDWPIVPAPGDYDDGEFGGMKIGRGNRSTWRKPYHSATLSTTNST